MVEKERRLKIVFMGTPPFASAILQKIMDCAEFDILAAYCQPDRASGRGRKIIPCAVKLLAQDNLNIHQPLNFKDSAEVETLSSYAPDFLVVAAYGIILPQQVLDIPRYAPLNVHASLLPQYRGAAPIQRAIWDNNAKSGVSIMRMERSLDTGPVYATQAVSICEHTSATMHNCLAECGGNLLLECMHNIACCDLKAKIQDESLATYASKLSKNDGIIDWFKTSAEIHAQIRAVIPWPNPQIHLALPNDKIFQGQILEGKIICKKIDAPCGSIWHGENGAWGIVTLDGIYEITHFKLLGKQMISACEFARGYFPKMSNCLWGRVLSRDEIINNA